MILVVIWTASHFFEIAFELSARLVFIALEPRSNGEENVDPYDQDVQEYAMATRLVPTSCEDETVTILANLRRNARFPSRLHRAMPPDP